METWDEQNNDVDVSIWFLKKKIILNGHVCSSNSTIFDPTLMHHYIGYNLYAAMGRYASRTKFVELEVNETYQGVYVFMEKPARRRSY